MVEETTTALKKKQVNILGSTGTIGQNTLDLIRRNREKFEINVLTGDQNIKLLAEQAIEFNAKYVVTASADQYENLKSALSGTGIPCAAGQRALIEAASHKTDITMTAIVGVAGLQPALAALENSSLMALANKECLVSAGDLFMRSALQNGTTLIPVDSEHSAAYQCLTAENRESIHKLTLTASGGPFREFTQDQLAQVSKAQALKHPNWEMGAKITIDSATLMNKGLELIEAKYLFALSHDQIDMVVHPQSIIHCMVSFKDGAMLAQMSEPDMRVPIAYSLAWPNRMSTPMQPVDLAALGQLTFEPGDEKRFPCLRIAREVLEQNNASGPALNAANEIAVNSFLKDQCSYTDIPKIIESVLEKIQSETAAFDPYDLNSILHIDNKARQLALEWLKLPVLQS